jgi:hypothetical protein
MVSPRAGNTPTRGTLPPMSERPSDREPDEEDRHLASGLGIGVAIGVGAGAAMSSVTGESSWIAIGPAVGVAVAAALRSARSD